MENISKLLMGLVVSLLITAPAAWSATVSFSGEVTSADSRISSLVQVGDEILFTASYDDSILPSDFTGFANLNPIYDDSGSASTITVGNTSFSLKIGALEWGIEDFSGIYFEPAIYYVNGDVVDVVATPSMPTGGGAELTAILLNEFGITSPQADGKFDVTGVYYDAYDVDAPATSYRLFEGTLALDTPPAVPLPASASLLLGGLGLLWLRRRKRVA